MITTERKGRRTYIMGNTFVFKDAIKAAGGNWDSDTRAWWIGSDAKATELVARLSTATEAPVGAPKEGLADNDTVVGKATYKGKNYLLVWSGNTKRGPAAKLAFTDGAKVFWADMGEVTVTKRYQEPVTLGKLKRLRAEFKATGNDFETMSEARAERSGRCQGCGGPIRNARHHVAMEGYCGSCAFDEFDC